MISSEQGLEILRNWRAQETVLWLVSFEFSDMAHGTDVRVETVSVTPPGAVLRFEGTHAIEALDLLGAEFDETGADESPFPDLPLKRLLQIRLPSGRLFGLAEREVE